MTKKEELLQVAAEVLAGKRPRGDLEAHGITLGEPIVGDEAKKMLLDQLEQEDARDRQLAEQISAALLLWKQLVARGAEEGTLARFEATFVTNERAAAESLADEYNGSEWAPDGCSRRIFAERAGFEPAAEF